MGKNPRVTILRVLTRYFVVICSYSRRKKEANLKNALFSVSGLFCLVLYFYHEELRANDLQPWPKLLTINPEWNPRIRDDVRPGYILPEFQT